MKPNIRRTHDLSLILQEETLHHEYPNMAVRRLLEQPEVPSFTDKNLRHSPIPSVNILGVDQSKAYQPHYSYDSPPPIPPVYSLTEPTNKRGAEFHSATPSKTLKLGLQDNWRDSTLGRRTRSRFTAPHVGNLTCETSPPPSKVRTTENPNLPILRPISQTNVQKSHSNEKPCDKTVWRSCHHHPEPHTQGTQEILQGTPPPVEPPKGQLDGICQAPNGPGTSLQVHGLHHKSPPLNSHSNLHLPSKAVSRCSLEPNRLPSIQCLTQALEKGGSHDMNAVQSIVTNHSQQKTGYPSKPWDPKLEDDDHRFQNGGHSAPSVQNEAGNPNMMYVNNIVQNVYFPSEKHRQVTNAPAHYPPQLSHRPVAELVKTIAPPHEAQDSSNEDGRIYDLAKIRQVGLTVTGGRVYNQQNHPMCAAPRENGIPCKRNVSRSACRWHGSVRVLTPHNTMNGLLDNFGNLAHVDPSINVNADKSDAHSPGSEQHQIVPPGASVPQRFSPPRVVARSLRWNNEEHYWFLLGLQRYEHRWSTISKVVRTRDTLQVQSHAQKYFERQNKVDKKKSTIHDLRIDGTELSEVAAKYTAEEIRRRVNLLDVDSTGIGNRSNVAASGN